MVAFGSDSLARSPQVVAARADRISKHNAVITTADTIRFVRIYPLQLPNYPITRLPDLRDCLPVLHQVLGGPPGESLSGERRIVRAARPHHRRAENPEVRDLVREAI